MKRKILFRGKAKDTGEWVYGDLSSHMDGKPFIGTWVQSTTDCLYRSTQVDPDTVGQFTGLHDKHGNPIFEGDIVLKRTYGGKSYCSVRFDGGMFHCGYGGGSSTPTHRYTLEDKRIEVVGNIYDNQELMETQ